MEQGWQETPASVHLTVVPVDFGDDQEDGAQGNCNRETENRGIGGEVNCLERLDVANVSVYLIGQRVQLRQELSK